MRRDATSSAQRESLAKYRGSTGGWSSPVDGLHILGTMEVRGRIWSSMPSAAPDIGQLNGIAPQRCWRPELPGSYRFGRAARLPQLTLYANDALSQLIKRKEQLAQTHRREKRI
jgi:hypothetical protein